MGGGVSGGVVWIHGGVHLDGASQEVREGRVEEELVSWGGQWGATWEKEGRREVSP